MHRRIWALFLLVPSIIAWPIVARAEKVSITSKDDVFTIEGRFTAKVTPVVAWGVLTDYQHIHDFVKTMQTDSIQRLPGGPIILHQTIMVGWPNKHPTAIKLVVDENPGIQQIAFRDTMNSEFSGYTGHWLIACEPGECTAVNYYVRLRIDFALPACVTKFFLHRFMNGLLNNLESEMVRRSAMGNNVPIEPVPSGLP